MSWSRFLEEVHSGRKNRTHSKEDSLELSQNHIEKLKKEDSLGINALLSTPSKSNNKQTTGEIDYGLLVEVLSLVDRANLKIAELQRRLSIKPTTQDSSTQTDPTAQQTCLRKIVQRLLDD